MLGYARQVHRWLGWWLLWAVPFFALLIPLQVLFRHSDSYLLSFLPFLVAGTGGSVMSYRGIHGFWPWDFKRRTIERWAWLVESPLGRRDD